MAGRNFVSTQAPFKAGLGDLWQNNKDPEAVDIYVCTKAGRSAGWQLLDSGAVADAGEINFSAGTQSRNLASVVFSNSNGVSFGLSQSTITASVNAGGGGATLSGFFPFGFPDVGAAGAYTFNTIPNNTPEIVPMPLPADLHFDRAVIPVSWSQNVGGNTGTFTVFQQLVLYSSTGSTLSVHASQTYSTSVSFHSDNDSLFSGPKVFTIPWTTTLTAGNYWLAEVHSTTRSSTNCTWQVHFNPIFPGGGNGMKGIWNAASASTVQNFMGYGKYSTTTTLLPDSLQFSEIRPFDGNNQYFQFLHFTSGTA